MMNLDEIKALLKAADKETEMAHQDYSKKSAAHKVALQIIRFEKELHYGDASTGQHLKKIKDIIEINAEDIVDEVN
jgi:cation transport regulator ChaB